MKSTLDEFGLTAETVLEGHNNHGLMAFTARAAREAGYGVKADPLSDSDRPLRADPAHAVLTGTPTTSKQRRKLARALLNDKSLVMLRDPIGGDE